MSVAAVSPVNTSLRLFYLLLVVISVTRLGSGLYLPALPAMREDLGVSTDALNSTLTVFFIAFALATLLAGPMVDAYGRRTVIRAGLLIFIGGSVLGGLAQDMPQLWAARILQALGVAFVPVSARVMVRDAYSDREVVGILGWIGAVSSLAPILSTILGGLIVQYINWQATFYVLALAAAVAVALTWRTMPETMRESQPLLAHRAIQSYGHMCSSGSFSLVILPLVFCFAIQGVYFATAPYIFVNTFGLKPSTFGFANIVLIAALIAGRQMAMLLSQRYSPFTCYVLAALLAPAGGLFLLAFFVMDNLSPVTFLIGTSIYCLGFGGLMPIGMKSILTAWQAEGGKASSLFGCCTFGSMAIGSKAVSLLGDHPDQKLFIVATLTLLFGLLTTTFAACTKKWLA